MRLQLILPRVEPSKMEVPSICPYQSCQGRHFRHHQVVDKAVKDTLFDAVSAQRYKCLRCGRTFRLYPKGVTREQTSQRVKGLGVMLYMLGLSYGATSLALEALGVYLCKTSVYEAVPAAAEKVPGMKRHEVFAGVQTPALGCDLTSVKCNGEWLPLGLAVDDTTGPVLTVDALSAEDAETVRNWLEPVVEAVDAQLLVSDDADALKSVANDLGPEHKCARGM
jgi:transposase-like protein